MLAARQPNASLVHEAWGDNIVLDTFVDDDLSEVARTAAVKVTHTFRTARQCMAPIEGRGLIAHWHTRLGQLVLYSATQIPHIVRSGLAECLGLDHAKIRVVAPDVGGGFGYKGILLPEEVCACWLAIRLGRPIRWIEDRREHLTANANCREHHYQITAYADPDGRLLAIDCDATVDAGAYSSYPFSACLEPAQVASILPGPYRFEKYRCRSWAVATNKPPILPYRGVARAGVCFAIELMIDAVARAVGHEPYEVRLKNLVPPEGMPFDNITGKHFDSGDYPECLRRAVAAIGLEAIRERQARRDEECRIGVGFAVFCEQGAHGTSIYHGWGIPMVPGHEQASARLTPEWRARAAGRRPFARPGSGDDARPNRRRNSRDRNRQCFAGARRHRAHSVLDRHLGIALRGDGLRRCCRRLRRSRRAGDANLRAAVANRSAVGFGRGRTSGRSGGQHHAGRRGAGLVPSPAKPA
jgi:aerobic carbon-monoxide dehydrogenase large subunit